MAPEISVVVPTHDRPRSLATLMRSLAEQTLDRESFEVVIVDDGSADADAIAQAATSADGLEVRVLRHDAPRGPAASRNTGWRAAKAPLIALTDDDCRASREWLAAILEAAAGQEAAIIEGRVEPEPEQLPDLRPLSHTIEIRGPNPFFVTCNIAYPRSLLERVGGFDESFLRACGEDVDLGARAVRAGGHASYADRALVYHEVRQLGLKELIRHTFKWTDGVRAQSMHPELRGVLFARVFWKPTHAWLLLAGAGIMTGMRTRRALPAALASLPYLRHYRRLYAGRPREALAALPIHLAVDVCEVLTVSWGSIRYRTVML